MFAIEYDDLLDTVSHYLSTMPTEAISTAQHKRLTMLLTKLAAYKNQALFIEGKLIVASNQ